MEFHLDQNRKENCHHDHIPFNVEGNENQVFSVCEKKSFLSVKKVSIQQQWIIYLTAYGT